MTWYRLSARLLAPLIVQRQRQANAPGNLDYLPGSTLRGACAAHYLRWQGQARDEAFQRFFLEEPILFPDLLPSPSATGSARHLPLTVVSCKRQPGFRIEGQHGMHDTLIPRAVVSLAGKPRASFFTPCPVCQNDLKGVAGMWNGDLAAPRRLQPSLFYQRHTGIDRLTGTVAQGVFYTTFAMADYQRPAGAAEWEPQYLVGTLPLSEAQADFLSELLAAGPLYVGADRTRGYGALSVELQPTAAPTVDLLGWHAAFTARYTALAGTDPPAGLYFSLQAASPVILVDQLLRPVSAFTLTFPDLEQVFQIVRLQTIRGWQAAWGLPKPDDLALAPGSVALWRYGGTDSTGLQQYLQELTDIGLGLRREEGFGRLACCEPVHLQEVL